MLRLLATLLALALFLPALSAEEGEPIPYPLTICIVTDMELGSMGDPISIVHEGRQILLCCAGCRAAFEQDPEGYLRKIDAAVEAQAQENDAAETRTTEKPPQRASCGAGGCGTSH